MHIFKDNDSLQQYLAKEREQNKTIGFVATMGALHQGHLSLIDCANELTDVSVCSIYVNPTQFNEATDLENYPITIDADIKLLQSANCDVLFLPTQKDIYPNGTDELLKIDLEGIALQMEGASRPGHFDGVVTVVYNLFQIVQPNKAFFGEKDFQQLAVIQKMTEIMQLDIQIVGCAILREKDGLAMSSRNALLSVADRKEATFIHQTLQTIVDQSDVLSPLALKKLGVALFKENPHFKLEYFEVASAVNLKTITAWGSFLARVFVAAKLKNVRLIDNMLLKN